MRRHRRGDETMLLPVFDELAAQGQALLVAGCIWRRKLQDRLAQDRTHPHLGRHPGDFFLEVVHIIEGGHAAEQHFGAGQARPHITEVRSHEFALDRHHVTQQPHIQAQIIRQTAQEGHGRVCVGIDQARDDQPIRAVHHGFCFHQLLDPFGRANGGDVRPSDGDGAVLVHIALAVHRHDGAANQQRIDFAHRAFSY